MKVLACLMLLLMSVSASAEDGAKLFTPCRACHSLDPADQGLPGPNLSSLIGRKVGGVRLEARVGWFARLFASGKIP